jgi:hypothetical protein
MQKFPLHIYFVFFLVGTLALAGCRQDQQKTGTVDYPIQPVSFTEVNLADDFWLHRIQTNTHVTVPIALEQSKETGRIKNFEVAGGLKEGTFNTRYAFDDSDVFKIIEGASYSLQIFPDPSLELYLDSLIHIIALAQEEDGYLYTNRTILGDSAHSMAGPERWVNVSEHSHELYNAGHMYEAAVAHYEATGKRTFLDVALRNADLIDREFGWGKIEKYPGHQEIEIGLVKLYRVTGEQKYLDLARFFLDVRGPDGWEYNQAHQQVTEQREPVGHAVRALYMYSAMADVAALTNDPDYLKAIRSIWESVVGKKIYITGGVGQTGGNEGFGKDYDLPNLTAYCETCASIANVFWNQRMFLSSGDGKYIDVLERTLYNALLSGVSLKGDRFFYPNPLESDGRHQRQEWFGCACCPSNICRFLPSVPGYIYAHNGNELYINLYIASTTTIHTPEGDVMLTQTGNYPWEGEIGFTVEPDQPVPLRILLHIPGWASGSPVPGDLYRFDEDQADNPSIAVNGQGYPYGMTGGYAVIERTWNPGDRLSITFPMPVKKVLAHDSILQDKGRFVLQRGPLVYCLEEHDQENPDVRHIVAEREGKVSLIANTDLFGGISHLEFDAWLVNTDPEGSRNRSGEGLTYRAIPYAYWANRGPGQMLTWIPYDIHFAQPMPRETIAYRSNKKAPGAKGALSLLSDQYDPKHSNDQSVGYIHWWPATDTTFSVIYAFDEPATVQKSRVFWFDDGPEGGCRIPQAWKIYYRSAGNWIPVATESGYPVTKDVFDQVSFEPVSTSALKLEIRLQKEYAAGIHEWIVQ